MTAKALLAAFVVAIGCTSFALAADSVSVNTDNGNITVADDTATYSDGQWSGQWVDSNWTPGYWYGGSWHQATWNTDTNDWTVSVDGNDYTLSESDWDAIPAAPMNGTPRSTSAVDSARSAEYGAVKGYTSTREPGMYNEGEGAGYHGDSDNDDDDDYSEGAKCGGNYSSGCGCKSKCGGGCGSKCSSRCGSKCGSKCGGGCGSKCGSCGGHKNSCGCPGAAYDCWGVWHGDENNFAAIRDSDYDPVMGRGDRGGSLFGW